MKKSKFISTVLLIPMGVLISSNVLADELVTTVDTIQVAENEVTILEEGGETKEGEVTFPELVDDGEDNSVSDSVTDPEPIDPTSEPTPEPIEPDPKPKPEPIEPAPEPEPVVEPSGTVKPILEPIVSGDVSLGDSDTVSGSKTEGEELVVKVASTEENEPVVESKNKLDRLPETGEESAFSVVLSVLGYGLLLAVSLYKIVIGNNERRNC